MKTIDAKKLSNVAMVNGNEKRYSIVIHNGILKEWVGIGWIELRKANAADRSNYPRVKGCDHLSSSISRRWRSLAHTQSRGDSS
jgi:hypothetical protein